MAKWSSPVVQDGSRAGGGQEKERDGLLFDVKLVIRFMIHMISFQLSDDSTWKMKIKSCDTDDVTYIVNERWWSVAACNSRESTTLVGD